MVMVVEINASEAQIRTMIDLTVGHSGLKEITSQLERSLTKADDTQSGEIPEEGDNAIIKRNE